MRAKIFIITAVILFLLLGFVYENNKVKPTMQNLSKSSYAVVNNLTGAALTVKQTSITNKRITVKLSNGTKDVLTYGSFYAIEKYRSGTWYTYRIIKPVTSGRLGKQSQDDNGHKEYYLASEFEVK